MAAPPWEDDAAVPVLRELDGREAGEGRCAKDGALPVTWDGLRATCRCRAWPARSCSASTGGALGEITDELVAAGASREQVARDRRACATMEKMNRLLLAAPAG